MRIELVPYDDSMREDMAEIICQDNPYLAAGRDNPKYEELIDFTLYREGVLYRVILDAESGEVLGEYDIHDTREDDWEIGVKIIEGRWGEGIATEAMALFLAEMRDAFGKSSVVAKIMPDNVASVRLAQRFGAEPRTVERSEVLIDDEMAERLAAENAGAVDGSTEEMGELFDVPPENLIGNVLVFDMPTDPDKWSKSERHSSRIHPKGSKALSHKEAELFKEELIESLERIAELESNEEMISELEKMKEKLEGAFTRRTSHVTIRKIS